MQYSKEYSIHYYNSDIHLNASVTSLLRMMEDIAIQQSEERGVGLKFYHTSKVAWMLTRWKVDFIRLPKFNDTLTLRTTPKAFRGFYANREYEFYNKSDELLIRANTLWIFVNTESRRPLKIPDEMFSHYQVTDEDMKSFTKLEEVPAIDRIDHARQFEVHFKDIDTNQHVNNTLYVEWAIETLPAEIKQSHRMRSLKVNYLKETKLGDKITANLQIENVDNSVISRCSILCGETEVCRSESEWVPI
jgi:medium-chain acyl-[acyl-carrier-protein] hydrolase